MTDTPRYVAVSEEELQRMLTVLDSPSLDIISGAPWSFEAKLIHALAMRFGGNVDIGAAELDLSAENAGLHIEETPTGCRISASSEEFPMRDLRIQSVKRTFWWPHAYARQEWKIWTRKTVAYQYFINGKLHETIYRG